jgi:hypothetical protein
MSSKGSKFDWRKWMTDRFKKRPGRPDVLDMVSYPMRPGLNVIYKRLDKRGFKDVDWSALRLWHVRTWAIDEYDLPIITQLYYRLRSKGFAPLANEERIYAPKRVKKITPESEFLELMETIAAKSNHPDGIRVAMKMIYYMGLPPRDLDHIRVSDIFKVNGDWLVYSSKRLTVVPAHMVDDFRAWVDKKKNDIPNTSRQAPRLFLTTMMPLIKNYRDLADTLSLIKKFRA